MPSDETLALAYSVRAPQLKWFRADSALNFVSCRIAVGCSAKGHEQTITRGLTRYRMHGYAYVWLCI